MTAEDRAKRLSEYFRRQIAVAAAATSDMADEGERLLHRKTLLVSILDGLAGLRFDKKGYPELAKQNRQRFTRFLAEYGNWPLGSRVSTPFLVSRLETDKLTGPLLEAVRGRLQGFDSRAGGTETIEAMDFDLRELQDLVRNEKEEKAIEHVQHWSLVYRYRNHLVHEARVPGYGMELFAEDHGSACYHSYVGEDKFFLAYPVALFRQLASSAVDSVEGYFLSQGLDPYDRVSDTSRW